MLPCYMPTLDLLPIYNRCHNLPSRGWRIWMMEDPCHSLIPCYLTMLDLLIGEEGGEPDWFPPSRYVGKTCYWGETQVLTA